ncbi:MAG TPA: hypothetical protein EYN91_12175 [Candidatus Melainabacteria bacterium]|nr:hypothetical protein [Candidatus Melainabacteria bacterium]HIN66591.1 hypothetical protein [Candidatus Obscuribacterales bacterium]
MKFANFKEKIKAGKTQIGTIVSLSPPAVTECLSNLGYDWLWIDLEHAPLSLEQVQAILAAKVPECAGLVRVPTNADEWIKRVLDIGADGIIVPHVSSKEDALRAVKSAKYPPFGERSFGAGRAHTYGIDATHHEKANELTCVIVQIEDRDAVKNIDEIISVEGVDGIIIGPYDLSGSFGKLGKVADSEVQTAIKSVLVACQKRKVPAGIFALLPEQAKDYLDAGFSLVAVGVDLHTLWTSAKEKLQELRGTGI